MIERMEKPFYEELLYKSWDSSAEEEKSKHSGGLQNREGGWVTVTFSWLSAHVFTCNLLFTTSYNAGVRDDVMGWTGSLFKTNKSKYVFI